jgi:multiple sugar transport system substrate-binding protein
MKYVMLVIAVVFVAMWAIARAIYEPPPDDGTIRLRWATDKNPARDEQTALFGRLNPGYSVVVESSDYARMIVRCATGSGPDIIDTYNRDMLLSFVSAGILLDITDEAQAGGFSPANTYPAIGDALVVNGRQYAFPCNVSANAVIYNRAIFDDHGVPYPDVNWTYDDFIQAAQAIQRNPSKSGKRHLAVANASNVGFLMELIIANQGRMFSPDGLRSALDSPEAIEAMQFYHDLIFKHQAIPSALEMASISRQGGWGAEGLTLFSGGHAAMIFIGRWYITQVPNYPEIQGKLGAARLPRFVRVRDGQRIVLPSAGSVGARAAGINARSPRAKEAMKFLQYLASPEYGRLIVEGGDSFPPNPSLGRSGAEMVNAIVPDPQFHQVFVDAMNSARVLDNSPYIDASLVYQWVKERVDRVENRLMTPEEAMRDVAREINERNLKRDPELRRRAGLQ